MSIHRTVLLNEAIEGLNLLNNSLVVDGTFGAGGHSREICDRYKNVKIIALDQDKSAWKNAKDKFKSCDITFVNDNFKNLDQVLKSVGVGEVDGIILDLGLSSDQLERSGRGFSFLVDEPLLMTMKENPSKGDVTAEDVVNTWSEKNLADIIYGYGEERFSRRIAKGIVEARDKKAIKTTGELVKIISDAVPVAYRRGSRKFKLHFATRTFQAIRIAVNDELTTLSIGLEKGFDVLKVGGRMSVISFHSLEDRIVKRFYSAKGGSASGGKENRVANIITKKPITASLEEIKNNPRSRSAKLRILEKTTA